MKKCGWGSDSKQNDKNKDVIDIDNAPMGFRKTCMDFNVLKGTLNKKYYNFFI